MSSQNDNNTTVKEFDQNSMQVDFKVSLTKGHVMRALKWRIHFIHMKQYTKSETNFGF